MLALLVALRLWYRKLQGQRVKILCDNSATISLLNSGKAKDIDMQDMLREIVIITATHNIEIFALHVEGVNNRMADVLSRSCTSTQEFEACSDMIKVHKLQNIFIHDKMFMPTHAW